MIDINKSLSAIGIPGVIGVGIIIACIGFTSSAIVPARKERDTQKELMARIKDRFKSVSGSAPQPGNELDQFYNAFPKINELADQLGQLYSLARKQNLQLKQGDYKLQNQNDQMLTYEITLPVNGSYKQIRGFIATAMNELPILALQSIRIEKQKSSDAQIQAKINFALYLRPMGSVQP